MSIAENVEPLSIGGLVLRVGVGYRVIAPFFDDGKVMHPIGEKWLYQGYSSPKMYPGYIIHACFVDGGDLTFRLKWGEGGQQAVTSSFTTHVCGPAVNVQEDIARLTDDESNLLNRYANDMCYSCNQSCNEVLEVIRSEVSNVACAAGRSGEAIYETAEADLRKLDRAIDRAMTATLQGRFE